MGLLNLLPCLRRVYGRLGVRVIPVSDFINDPKHWRARGEEVRAMARIFEEPEAKEMMFVFAVSLMNMNGSHNEPNCGWRRREALPQGEQSLGKANRPSPFLSRRLTGRPRAASAARTFQLAVQSRGSPGATGVGIRSRTQDVPAVTRVALEYLTRR